MTTSQRLKELRLERNFSQDYIAFELGISQKTYSNLESGKSKIGLEHLNALSKIYNSTLIEFIQAINLTDIARTTINRGESPTTEIQEYHIQTVEPLKKQIEVLNELILQNQATIQNLQSQINSLK
ncbi:MAG: helix-turn-helix domain-containing protein [Aquaticitalea sp.]